MKIFDLFTTGQFWFQTMRHDELSPKMVFISKSIRVLVPSLTKILIFWFSSQDPNCAISKTIINFFAALPSHRSSLTTCQILAKSFK